MFSCIKTSLKHPISTFNFGLMMSEVMSLTKLDFMPTLSKKKSIILIKESYVLNLTRNRILNKKYNRYTNNSIILLKWLNWSPLKLLSAISSTMRFENLFFKISENECNIQLNFFFVKRIIAGLINLYSNFIFSADILWYKQNAWQFEGIAY